MGASVFPASLSISSRYPRMSRTFSYEALVLTERRSAAGTRATEATGEAAGDTDDVGAGGVAPFSSSFSLSRSFSSFALTSPSSLLSFSSDALVDGCSSARSLLARSSSRAEEGREARVLFKDLNISPALTPTVSSSPLPAESVGCPAFLAVGARPAASSRLFLNVDIVLWLLNQTVAGCCGMDWSVVLNGEKWDRCRENVAVARQPFFQLELVDWLRFKGELPAAKCSYMSK